jgi:hypothetical protein
MADKALERKYLDRAFELINLRATQPIVESETPDFFAVLDGAQIGIEVTRFYLSQAGVIQVPQARFSMEQLAVEQAWQMHKSQGGPALYVSVHFTSRQPLTKRRAYELSALLAEAVAQARVPMRLDEGHVRIDQNLPPEIWGVSILRSFNGEDGLWHRTTAGWLDRVERAHIGAEISRKAASLPAIRTKCVVSWLPIVNDPFRGAPFCELSSEARKLGFQSPFDRTVWLDTDAVYDLGAIT